jgi:hypothetical protein
MAVPADKTYPATATNAAWQKKKSFLDKAKAKTKTGLGATLAAAEASWKAIPWADLDASTKTAGTPESAQRLLTTAKEGLKKVTKAQTDLKAAKLQAKKTKLTSGLSKTASDAAAKIEIDLNQAINRLGLVKLDDFEQLVKKVQSQGILNVSKISVSDGKTTVMRGTAATWDRKVLKVSGVTWQGGATAVSVAGQKLKVQGETAGNDPHSEGISKLFANDMKLDKASGNTASFVSY